MFNQSVETAKRNVASNFNFTFNRGNELKLTQDSFENWRKYIYDLAGIYFQDNKKYLLESRLLKRIKILGLKSYEEYLDYVKRSGTRSGEISYLYEVITINETYFFRNTPQLEALVTSIVPELYSTNRNRNKIRIWSAASSSGEEAYSIAMIFNDLIKPKFPNLNVEIIGSDISKGVLSTARSGIYKEYAIRNLPPNYLRKYFKINGSSYELDTKIKSMVRFKELNLFDPIGMRSMINFDVIFCANVLIYFDIDSKIKVVSNLYNSLNQKGYLFIGYSETLHGISKSFRLVSFPKTTGYKKE